MYGPRSYRRVPNRLSSCVSHYRIRGEGAMATRAKKSRKKSGSRSTKKAAGSKRASSRRVASAKRSASTKRAAARKPASAKRKAVAKSGKRSAAKRSAAKRPAGKRSTAKRSTAKTKSVRKPSVRRAGVSSRRSPMARVTRVAKEVAQQATIAVTESVDALKELGETLMDRVAS
jgi:hypothetical protein